jgi:type III pantothenate kinase
MVAVFDIGNTNIHIGLYIERELVRKLIYPTHKRSILTKIGNSISRETVNGVAIASVVPAVTKKLVALCKKQKIKPLVVSPKLECGLKYSYRDPSTLGSDRIAAVVGALSRFKRDVITIDGGTAITIDVARLGGYYLGGIICPGMNIMAESMHGTTAQLPRIAVREPGSLIGVSTDECMRSGVYNGTIAMIQGLIRAIKKQVEGNFFCVATGGSGRIMAEHVTDIAEYDENLCLQGALEIYYKNV